MESYTQSYTRKCQSAKDFSVSGVGNVGFFKKNFFWKRDSSLFLHHIPGESVCREILAFVSLCPESLFPGDASSACRREPLNRRWGTLIHGDTPCASKVCLRIVDTNMKMLITNRHILWKSHQVTPPSSGTSLLSQNLTPICFWAWSLRTTCQRQASGHFLFTKTMIMLESVS